MQTSTAVQFKTLLSSEEYSKIMEKFRGNKLDYQTNHYFDTTRFSLKALDSSLRVRERDTMELTLKRKKGYSMQDITVPITPEIFEDMKMNGTIPDSEIKNELIPLIADQKLVNFISLSTLRMYLPYKNGVLYVDKNEYLGNTDYELEYEAKNYNEGKKDFIQLISELGIQYKKSDKKIKRAFNAYKKVH